ncbi:MAG: hypothetical protein K2Q01_01310 [Rickettsiales bacterium]|nr:hypothetical protein [Rickettsiales bacterium]
MRTKESVITLIKEHAEAYKAANPALKPQGHLAPLHEKKLPGPWVDLEKGELIEDACRLALHKQYNRLGNNFDKASWLEDVNAELRLLTRNEISRTRRIVTDAKVTEERIGGEVVLHGFIQLNGEILLNVSKAERSPCPH